MAMEQEMFIGVMINDRLQASLDAASLPFRRYFEGGKFLTIVETEEEAWLGKAIGKGASGDRLDDMKRHVWSVIRKIDPAIEIPFEAVEVTEVSEISDVSDVSEVSLENDD
jgi:hypothetical protein